MAKYELLIDLGLEKAGTVFEDEPRGRGWCEIRTTEGSICWVPAFALPQVFRPVKKKRIIFTECGVAGPGELAPAGTWCEEWDHERCQFVISEVDPGARPIKPRVLYKRREEEVPG